MDNGQDDNAFVSGAKQDHVRKAPQERAPHLRTYFSVCLRHPGNRRERGITCAEEIRPKSGLSLLIPSKRRVHFERGGSQDLDWARPKVHLRAVQLVLEDAVAHLLPGKAAFAALIEISKASL
jgi:hypothetical protein